MPHEIFAPAQPNLLVAFLAVVAISVLIGVAAARFTARMRRQAWRERDQKRWIPESRRAGEAANGPWFPMPAPPPPDAASQLRIVMRADFWIKPLLNKGEARVFKEVDRIVNRLNPSWQVMAQVSLGEILRSKDADAFRCINAKRVDLLLIDEECRPRHAIEYQGCGHHQGNAAARDAVKKEALRRAGVGYYEVIAGRTTPTELKRMVEKLVVKPAAGAAPDDRT